MKYYDQLLAAGTTALFFALFYSFQHLGLIEDATRPTSLIALYFGIRAQLNTSH